MVLPSSLTAPMAWFSPDVHAVFSKTVTTLGGVILARANSWPVSANSILCSRLRNHISPILFIDLLFFFLLKQTRLLAWDLATGSTVSSDTNPHASVTGPAGTRQPLNSSVSVVCSTMKRNTLAIGPKLSRAARNIVIFTHCTRISFGFPNTQFRVCSFVQGWRQWQRSTRQVLQPLLGLPGGLPSSSALPGHVGLRQALPPLHQPTDRGLRGSSTTTSRGWPQCSRWSRLRRRGRARCSCTFGLIKSWSKESKIIYTPTTRRVRKKKERNVPTPHSSLY